MTVPLFHVDAFTDRPFAGNPAAVCLLPSWKGDRWLQAVAREMNLSETAFLVEQPDHFDLRWFTPKAEVDLCGHATLASAHVLWTSGAIEPGQPIRFQTRSGLLACKQSGALIELDFPATPATPADPSDPASLDAAITLPEEVAPVSLPVKPLIGPVLPLNEPVAAQGDSLMKQAPSLSGDRAYEARRALRDGVAPKPRPGRADDFRWPRS